MEMVISPDGLIRCLYFEDLDLTQLGELKIRRASHVEPDDSGNWWSDLSPVSGPVLGPYPVRSLALAAEMNWLREHWLAQPDAS